MAELTVESGLSAVSGNENEPLKIVQNIRKMSGHKRIDTSLKQTNKYKITLEENLFTTWYIIVRSNVIPRLTWWEYIFGFLVCFLIYVQYRSYIYIICINLQPYPLFGILIWILQLYTIFLLYTEFQKDVDTENIAGDALIVQARRVAFIFIAVYVLMIGKHNRNLIKTIIYDLTTDKSFSIFNSIYLLLPLIQTIVECFALYSTTNVILSSNNVIDTFKDCVAMFFILEVDGWASRAITKQDVGLDDSYFTIHMPMSHKNKTCKEKCCQSLGSIIGFCIYFGGIIARLSILVYGMLYNILKGYF